MPAADLFWHAGAPVLRDIGVKWSSPSMSALTQSGATAVDSNGKGRDSGLIGPSSSIKRFVIPPRPSSG